MEIMEKIQRSTWRSKVEQITYWLRSIW